MRLDWNTEFKLVHEFIVEIEHLGGRNGSFFAILDNTPSSVEITLDVLRHFEIVSELFRSDLDILCPFGELILCNVFPLSSRARVPSEYIANSKLKKKKNNLANIIHLFFLLIFRFLIHQYPLFLSCIYY